MDDHPQVVYRVVSKEDWEITKQVGRVPRCGSDERDGYVHLSTAETMLQTANLYFEPAEEPLIIEIQSQSLGEALRWEKVASRNDQIFPHLYAEGIPYPAVTAYIELVAQGQGFVLGSRVAIKPT